jgi:hypothetical protein
MPSAKGDRKFMGSLSTKQGNKLKANIIMLSHPHANLSYKEVTDINYDIS